MPGTRPGITEQFGSELSRGGLLLRDLILELERLRRKLLVPGLLEERIKPAAMIDGLECVGRDAQLDRAAERIRHQRDVQQVRQEAPLGLDVRMADLMANQWALAGQIATARHGRNP